MSDYRYVPLQDTIIGDVFIRSITNEECVLTSIIDQPNERDKKIFMFHGFNRPKLPG